MTTELTYLVYVSVLTALLWVPYILNLIIVRAARRTPSAIPSIPSRSRRGRSVLVAHAAGVNDDATQMCAIVYFWSRVVHPIAYALAIPVVRTLAFVTGWSATLCIAWQIVAR